VSSFVLFSHFFVVRERGVFGEKKRLRAKRRLRASSRESETQGSREGIARERCEIEGIL
jgi:hypothetical protein